ncbi:MAG: hypothetical protein M3Y26_06750 [Actinomycetota bacterium]|nr:hypothetical protein [Actinomycetota bacterium]
MNYDEPCDPTDLAPMFRALELKRSGETIPDDLVDQVDYIACVQTGLELVRAGADPDDVFRMYDRPHHVDLSYDRDGDLSMSVVFDDEDTLETTEASS